MWYTGTKQECEDYNNLVTNSKDYQGTTKNWSSTIEIDGAFFVVKKKDYLSQMKEVKDLPTGDEG